MPLEPYPARYARHLPHAGKALSVVILFPHMCVFALTLWGKRYSRIVAFPAWGRGTAPAVDRVLSLTAHLRRIFHLFHLSFIPPVPYPPLRGTFPSRGRLTIRGKPAVKRPSGIVHLYSAALRSFDSVLPFQISHFFSAQDDEMRRTTTLNLEPSFAQSKGTPPAGFPFYPIRSTTSFAQSRSI